MKKPNLKTIINVVTIGLFAFAIYALRDDIAQTIKNIKNADFYILALIPFLQYYNYYSIGELYKTIYKIFKVKVGDRESTRLALELNFVGFILPTAGVSSISYLAIRMRDRALASVSTTVMGMKILIQNLSFVAFLLVGLFILSLSGQASNLLILISSTISLLIIFAGAVGVYIISSKARIKNFAGTVINFIDYVFNKLRSFKNSVVKRISSKKVEKKINKKLDKEKIINRLTTFHDNYLILKRNRSRLVKPLFYGFMANLTELATIYVVFGSTGYWVNPGAIIIAYAVASFSGIFSILPGGVGTFEALMVTVMVSSGVPAGVSIPAIIMYRIINTVLSMPIGYYFYHKQLNNDSSLKLKKKTADGKKS